jgi:two-component system, OmpR family, response regulator
MSKRTSPPFINWLSCSGEAGFARLMPKLWSNGNYYMVAVGLRRSPCVRLPGGEVAKMTRVLVVEDDPRTANEIKEALGDHGFQVDHAATGREGLLKAAAGAYDAIVLDRMLPGGLDGLGVLSTLRTAGVDAPVLILSALSAVDERVRGLRAGGDDYLTKPFDFLELTARLDVLLRRQATPRRETVLRAGKLEMDLLTRTVHHGERLIELLPREYRLLEFLMRHAGQVVTRTMLFEEVWNYRSVEPTNVIDMHISKLRRKIDPENSEPMIRTVRGAGYMLHASG